MIDLTVKALQELLNVNQDVHIDCFNMVVRILAHNEPKWLSITKRKITKYYDINLYSLYLYIIYYYVFSRKYVVLMKK
jgi:hypothetical protein